MQTNVSPEELQRVLDQVNGNAAAAQTAAANTAQKMILAGQRKSMGLAFALAFFFGPLGLLYASPLGAVVMFVGGALFGAMTLGLGLFFAWLGSIIWACAATAGHNDRIDAALRL